ncbi:tRNA-specific adenosine deaminase, putative (macronuclear) [Tetrahymena thermophila SB210]|uniref:tRNA-specific adenosine deaminase, putative n=1 Tax=Tetrahymena thermophila (strain SB210) TaxID=312017 RepID=Q23RA5_TETTS|nr:tRNA-specific adenosine deaminase, putative [Tetrahymena thermophila SB210]EAR99143.2 tRNA-specific adenosine deaminase, putative [Tetrahymena thermophila SB210]|eukprot:XP_001019388.2 tRNA-specific adenosine deaminase, putative [Tetrahymena thermophila SB210]
MHYIEQLNLLNPIIKECLSSKQKNGKIIKIKWKQKVPLYKIPKNNKKSYIEELFSRVEAIQIGKIKQMKFSNDNKKFFQLYETYHPQYYIKCIQQLQKFPLIDINKSLIQKSLQFNKSQILNEFLFNIYFLQQMVDIKLLKQILQAIHDKFNSVFQKVLKKDISDAQEQTVLASIVLILQQTQTFEIISIANGTKSIGKKNMSELGNLVNDSHAEILARRAFKKFLYDNLNNPKYFQINDNNKYVQKFKVLFYTSQTPCGQASIFQNLNGNILPSVSNCIQDQVINSSNNETQTPEQKQKFFQNTGAKYYSFLYDEKYQVEKDQQNNILRIKPGRSDLPQDSRSQSLSCSDKIMIWNVIGLQGSLLSELLDRPIYIDYFFIESDGNDLKEFKQKVRQGINLETRLNEQFTNKRLKENVLKWRKKPISKNYFFKNPPIIVTKKYFFKLNRNLSQNKPKYLDQHIVYLSEYIDNNGEKKVEFTEILNGSSGLKWGMGEKGSQIPKNYPALCKYNLYKAYCQIKHMSSKKSYLVNKEQSIKYNLIKRQLLKLFKENIVDKKRYDNFCIAEQQ